MATLHVRICSSLSSLTPAVKHKCQLDERTRITISSTTHGHNQTKQPPPPITKYKHVLFYFCKQFKLQIVYVKYIHLSKLQWKSKLTRTTTAVCPQSSMNVSSIIFLVYKYVSPISCLYSEGIVFLCYSKLILSTFICSRSGPYGGCSVSSVL